MPSPRPPTPTKEAPAPVGGSLPRFAVGQPVLVNLFALVVVVAGVMTLLQMTREVYPLVPIGAASIVTTLVGASPEEVEELITAPIEDEIADIEGIDFISSTSSEGRSFIWVEFEASVEDVGRRVIELSNEVARVSGLPEGAEAPVVREASVRPPTIGVAIYGDAPEASLRAVGRTLKERLERIDGVAEALTTGIRDREIRVEVDPDRLFAYGVPLDALTQALIGRGNNVPAGQIEGGRRNRLVRGMAKVEGAADVANVVIRPGEAGGALRVRDVSRVQEGFAEGRTAARVNGQPAIVFLLLKQENKDAIRVSERVRSALASMERDLPAGIQVSTFGDKAAWVRLNLRILYQNAGLGLLLVMAILWFFIGFRNGAMAALGIPVALSGGVLLMAGLGITINLLSLLALILSLGIVVDDAIIIIENVYRHVQAGASRASAAVVGTGEVLWPVLASTATTCSAFLPMLLMTGVLGKFFAIIPKVVVAALVASAIEALFVLPSHLADFGARPLASPSPRHGSGRFERLYVRLLRWALPRRHAVIAAAVVVTAGWVGAALWAKEVVLFTDADVESFDVRVRLPVDASKEETDRVLAAIEARLLDLENPDVEAVVSLRGYSRTRGFPLRGDEVGMVTVYMKERMARTSLDAGTRLMERAMGLFDDIVGPVALDLVKFEDGPPRGAPVAVRLSGDDLDELAELSEAVQAELRRIPGTRNISDNHQLGKRELRLSVDEERAAGFGLTGSQVHRWLASALAGQPLMSTRRGDEEIDVVVELQESVRRDPDRLLELRLVAPAGTGPGGDELATVALSELASVEAGRGLSRVRRRNRHRAITVTAELFGGATSAGVNRALARRLTPLTRAHPDVRFEFGGEFEDTQESVQSLLLAFILAGLIIYAILASQFRSFVQPMVVMMAIPLSLLGVSIGFFASGEAVGLIALIGVVGLAGIVVNDSLVLVDFINVRRRDGLALDEAIVEAARLRLRPIWLTSITTIAGLAPLALGVGGRSELLAPMATAMSWGLCFSTGLILVVVPCLYRTVEGMAATASRFAGPLGRRLRGEV